MRLIKSYSKKKKKQHDGDGYPLYIYIVIYPFTGHYNKKKEMKIKPFFLNI